MKPQTWIWAVGFGVLIGCGAGEAPQEFSDDSDFGALESSLNKGTPGAASGQYTYCWPTSDPALLCTLGEGVCHSNAECVSGLVCGFGKLSQYLPGGQSNACTYAHCTNGVYEPGLGETQKDCGGPCGTICPDLCAGVKANGLEGHCTKDCPCPANEGDCNYNFECQSGLTCASDIGARYGFAANLDFCIASTCTNGVKDGTETGVDCGGSSCPPCAGTTSSAQSFGTAATLETPDDIAFASNGSDFVVAGRFNGTVNFGCGDMTAAGSTKADVYAAKYNASGNCLWSVRGGSVESNDGDYGVSVSIDSSGNVYVAGNFYATSTFLGQSLTVNGVTDIFVMKLSSAGALQWLKGFGGAGIDRVGGLSAYAGGVVMGGDFEGSAQFGSTTLTSAGLNDAVLLSLDTAGSVKWAKRYGGTGLDRIRGVDVASDNTVFAAGDFWNTVNFGAGNLTSAGRADAFAMRLSAAGATFWARRYGGIGDDVAVDVSFTRNGPVLGGYFSNSVDFGSGVANSATKLDGFALALAYTGAYRWHKVVTGPGDEEVRSSAADINGNTTLAGRYTTSMDWGGGSVPSNGASDVFVVTYGPTGLLKWGRSFGGTGGDVVDGAAIGTGVVRTVGRFAGSVDFDGKQLTAGGSYDAFTTMFPL